MNKLFDYSNCPLCDSKLELHVLDDSQTYITISYFCPQMINYYSESNREISSQPHFAIRIFKDGDIVTIALYPYLLNFNLNNNTTAITRIFLDRPRKYITSLPLLDIDYSQPYTIIDRLNKLLIFS